MILNRIPSPKQCLDNAKDALAPSVHRLAIQTKPLEKSLLASSWLFAKLPQPLQAKLLARLLNQALAEQIDNGELDFLAQRCCAIELKDESKDNQQRWHIGFAEQALIVDASLQPDVTISATAAAFLSLVSQSVDPDTLFFQRQLAIEGDVEMGLTIKNLLDALDEDELPKAWQAMIKQLRRLVAFESAVGIG
ncbi:ubiquinone anaerobic biosynthesis accessory factor UbiT [Reinekea thalattae]|uniref:Ubiquinone biosynthesis accessory factor UbiT n=1 Tax=Reinekea thalattae TaxID=2593301 RepID=A0A5C8Z2G8_9GAMM|nr:SCP2 sterol-binding domain-containing protein [Reinekea thalattae]TXR51431.1 hypothetical protein FME95_12975 [Reinekea thalattae]